jgi:hypothetical protein
MLATIAYDRLAIAEIGSLTRDQLNVLASRNEIR